MHLPQHHRGRRPREGRLPSESTTPPCRSSSRVASRPRWRCSGAGCRVCWNSATSGSWLVADPDGVSFTATEEMLRYTAGAAPPAAMGVRGHRAGGRSIRRGEAIQPMVGSADRDPRWCFPIPIASTCCANPTRISASGAVCIAASGRRWRVCKGGWCSPRSPGASPTCASTSRPSSATSTAWRCAAHHDLPASAPTELLASAHAEQRGAHAPGTPASMHTARARAGDLSLAGVTTQLLDDLVEVQPSPHVRLAELAAAGVDRQLAAERVAIGAHEGAALADRGEAVELSASTTARLVASCTISRSTSRGVSPDEAHRRSAAGRAHGRIRWSGSLR